MHDLTGSDIRGLRARGQTMKATVHLGKQGFSSAVRAELEQALLLSDLVKISVSGKGGARKAAAAEIARELGAVCVGVIGSSALMYRPRLSPS